jgi:hypothetical protein
VEIPGRRSTRVLQIIDADHVLDRSMAPEGPSASIRTRYASCASQSTPL